MPQNCAPFDWPETRRGTTVDARLFEVTVNGAAPSVNLAICTAIFKKDGAVTITAPVTITSESLWHITVGPIPANTTKDLVAGNHEWALHTIDTNGRAKDYVYGKLPIT